MFCLFFF